MVSYIHDVYIEIQPQYCIVIRSVAPGEVNVERQEGGSLVQYGVGCTVRGGGRVNASIRVVRSQSIETVCLGMELCMWLNCYQAVGTTLEV